MNATAPTSQPRGLAGVGVRPLPLSWLHREPPLVPAAVTATGIAAQALASVTAQRVDSGAVSLRAGVLGAAGVLSRLLVLGMQEDLPWCDGAQYLGWDAGILLPTARRPSVPAEILADEARRALGHPPVVVVLPEALVGMTLPRRTVDGLSLRAWDG